MKTKTNFIKKHTKILAALALVLTIASSAAATNVYAGTNNADPGDDYSFDVEVDVGTNESEIIVIDIENTHEPTTVVVCGTKIWIDDDNRAGLRPDEIVVHLYADGTATGKTATLSEATNWKYSFTNLAEFEAGTAIEYSIKEAVPTGYTVEYIRK